MIDAAVPTPRPPAPRRSRRAFTLTELLVAVGLVALLTLGIGQIYASISGLVGSGSALAETDQMARVVEAQIRADIAAMNRLPADRVFLGVRNRRVGDMNFNATLEDAGSGGAEVALYLTPDDERADRREGLDPYQVVFDGPDEIARSRAITTRLDEIVFPAFSGTGGGFQSAQPRYAGAEEERCRAERYQPLIVTADHARIYYGHGLRAAPNTDEPLLRNLFYADGDFGTAFGDENRFAPASELATGRNRFAGDFVFCRQPLLLVGGRAAGSFGTPAISGNPFQRSSIGADREYAPYVIDLETMRRFGPGSIVYEDAFEVSDDFEGLGGTLAALELDACYPSPRLIRHGRVDICAQDYDDLVRWLEGRLLDQPVADPFGFAERADDQGRPLGDDASAFGAGKWDWKSPAIGFGAPQDSPLWERDTRATDATADAAYRHNMIGVQTAVAGMLVRPLVEPDPPDLRQDFSELPGDEQERPNATDLVMDAHAILATRCSRFEIAWSDGRTWEGPRREVDRDGDGRPERVLEPNDTIWFDMDFTYADLWDELSGSDRVKAQTYPRPWPDPEVSIHNSFGNEPPGEFLPNASSQRFRDAALVVQDEGDAPGDLRRAGPDGLTLPSYSLKYNTAAERQQDEYLALWGFRVPTEPGSATGPGRYRDEAWPKPTLLRFRFTLHDRQFRLDGGREYEFIVRVNPQ